MKLPHEDKVRKSSHCAWQIHYHLVFPVKYRKVLLDEEVTRIIGETAVSIEERYPIEMEALGMDKNHIHILLQCSSQSSARADCANIQESYCSRDLPTATRRQARALGGRILVGWVLCCDGSRACQLADGGTVCPTARLSQRRCPTTETLLTLRYPVSLLRGSSYELGNIRSDGECFPFQTRTCYVS